MPDGKLLKENARTPVLIKMLETVGKGMERIERVERDKNMK